MLQFLIVPHRKRRIEHRIVKVLAMKVAQVNEIALTLLKGV